ncbi:MAG TPA: NUDIX domain-containing protein, partial [Opitutaceae bacterium]
RRGKHEPIRPFPVYRLPSTVYAFMISPPVARFSINVLENDRSELLLLKRSSRARLAPGRWGFPAGHIEDGEKPEDCALRELTEEIGKDFRVNPVQVFGPVRDTLYGGKYEVWLFHARWQGGTVRLNHEHTDHAWVSREKFRDYDPMDGTDEDIHYLKIWPRRYLRPDKLPKRQR